MDLNVASDRHILLHGGNILGQAPHVPKLVTAATDDDGSVRSANEHKPAPSRGDFTFLLLSNRSSIALQLLSLPTPPRQRMIRRFPM